MTIMTSPPKITKKEFFTHVDRGGQNPKRTNIRHQQHMDKVHADFPHK
jgi:hypothetical protein